VVIDLANSPSFEDKAMMEFFETERSLVPRGEARLGRIGFDELVPPLTA
jgi:hypothetical protein